MSAWLDGDALPSTPRKESDAKGFLAQIPKLKRAGLSEVELVKLKLRAEEGIQEKFCLMDGKKLDEVNTLSEVYSLTIRIEEFAAALRSFDLDDVFKVPADWGIDATGEPQPDGVDACDLLTQYGDVTLESVKMASAWYEKWGQRYKVENLHWSGDKLLNSYEQELREKIVEYSSALEIQYKTGPVYFKLMMDLILSSTPHSLRTVTKNSTSTTRLFASPSNISSPETNQLPPHNKLQMLTPKDSSHGRVLVSSHSSRAPSFTFWLKNVKRPRENPA